MTQNPSNKGPFRVGYVIGHLGAGGAERQLSELAAGMADRGHVVEIFCYNAVGEGAFDSYVQERGVKLHRMIGGGSKFQKLLGIKRWTETFRPQIVHGIMKRASSLAIISNLPWGRFGVIASDYSTATYAPYKPSLWGALVLFHLADCVVTETVANQNSLCRLAPMLRDKLRVIRNGVDDTRFCPTPKLVGKVFRFLCVGTVSEVKNPVRVVQALRILRQQTTQPFTLEWVGRYQNISKGGPTQAYLKASQLIDEYGLHDMISFKGLSESVMNEYQRADALVHVSVQEGIPNAVVEGMACGLPIVVSRVSDLPLVVEAGDNGITCNAFDPMDIARALKAMLEMQLSDRMAMGFRSRKLASEWFGLQRFVTDHEKQYLDMIKVREERGRGLSR
ncbi:MAG: glycosyltransferase [Nitrospirota bacterium]|nr:glycosyltransferase [Nitrospirota bacterium]